MDLRLVSLMLCSLLVASLHAASVRRRNKATPKIVINGPANDAVIIGDELRLTCRSSFGGMERIQWTEFGTNPSGALISDNDEITSGHPHAERYSIVHDTEGMFDLVINETVMSDGTKYTCTDANESPPQSLGAQLVMLESEPNCFSNVPSSNIVIEGDYHTIECEMNYAASDGIAPFMEWHGPEPFIQGYNPGDGTVWSGVSFTVDRTMSGQAFDCATNFTEEGFTGVPDMAYNVPSFEHVYRSPQLFVYWPPKNMYSEPKYELYWVNLTITCHIDASPPAVSYWQDMQTMQKTHSTSFTVTEDMIGNRTMRCHAENTIDGRLYYQDLFIPFPVALDPPTSQTPDRPTTAVEEPATTDGIVLPATTEAGEPITTADIDLPVTSAAQEPVTTGDLDLPVTTAADAEATGPAGTGTDAGWPAVTGDPSSVGVDMTGAVTEEATAAEDTSQPLSTY